MTNALCRFGFHDFRAIAPESFHALVAKEQSTLNAPHGTFRIEAPIAVGDRCRRCGEPSKMDKVVAERVATLGAWLRWRSQ